MENQKLKIKNQKLKVFFAATVFLLITYNLQLTPSYAESDIAIVERPFMEGKYEKAASEAQRLIDEKARQRYEAYYLKGLSELKLGRFKEARESFNAVISKYQKSNRLFDASIVPICFGNFFQKFKYGLQIYFYLLQG